MRPDVPTLQVLGVPVARVGPAEALSTAEQLYDSGGGGFIAHVNPHTVNLAVDDPSYAEVLRRAALVLNDGKGMMLAARLLGSRFPADMNGNFFGPALLERAALRRWPVFFLGAGPGVAERAAALWRERISQLDIAGTRDGYFDRDEEAVESIRRAGAGLVMVGMGNPLQERWMDLWLSATGANLGIGVGAFFDFSTGTVPRAPTWMNRVGLEWGHRLFKEPRRMWKRYLIGNPKFVARVLSSRIRTRAEVVQ